MVEKLEGNDVKAFDTDNEFQPILLSLDMRVPEKIQKLRLISWI